MMTMIFKYKGWFRMHWGTLMRSGPEAGPTALINKFGIL